MKKKRIKPGLIIITIGTVCLLTVTGIIAALYFQFNPEGYRITVPYRPSFTEISHNVYINKDYHGDKDSIVEIIELAEQRNREFFGDLKCLDDTIIILYDDDQLKSRLGGEKDTSTTVFPFRKNYICISDKYCNTDIISHEITHAELHHRLPSGQLFKIPTWFDEGLAIQNDYREQYSEQAWKERTENGKKTVALEDMDEPSEFYAGTKEERNFRYLNAGHEVREWLKVHKNQGLTDLIDKLSNNEDFRTAYGE